MFLARFFPISLVIGVIARMELVHFFFILLAHLSFLFKIDFFANLFSNFWVMGVIDRVVAGQG